MRAATSFPTSILSSALRAYRPKKPLGCLSYSDAAVPPSLGPRPIPASDTPTFDDFKHRILPSGSPHLLRGCIAHWPALELWRDFTAFKRPDAEDRVVPVELARIPPEADAAEGYNARGTPGASWDRVEMPLGVFVDAFLLGLVPEAPGDGGSWAAYLAQHALLDEVPSLKADVQPSLQYAQAGRGDAWRNNVWIGTRGTFTPVHRDPYHNLFCQIVGEKHVRVFPPNAADDLYISTDPLQRNTSLITTSAPDLKRFPRYEQALQDSWEATVGPGDVLFLPKGLFHSVRSLSKSVSVNEWFL